MSEITYDMINRAMKRFNECVNSMVECPRCGGKGYHHGFGEDGCDPDWCDTCGGCQSVPEFDDTSAMREAIRAALSPAPPVDAKSEVVG